MVSHSPKIKLAVFLTLFVAIFIFIFGNSSESEVIAPAPATINSEVPAVLIKDLIIPVAVMRTPAEIERGLSGMPSLPVNEGMIFVFPSPGIYQFWMPNMFFSIDIIWINQGKIVDISHNVPHDPKYATVLYKPKEPAQYVLEVNAGFSKKNGIVIGDSVRFRDI